MGEVTHTRVSRKCDTTLTLDHVITILLTMTLMFSIIKDS